MRSLVVGGTASGVGKTVTAMAIAHALEQAGYEPTLAKAGPDYIDPSHHAAAFGRPSRTLDTWMQGVEGVRRTLHGAAETGTESVVIVEGMMGLYDGSVTSTAATAAALDVPVVLVVDASAGMQSVGATALGFAEYARQAELPTHVTDAVASPRVDVVGVIAARAHGGRHARGIHESLPDSLEWFGHVPPMADLEIPDRHLGLHMGDEAPLSDGVLANAAAQLDGAALGRAAGHVARPTQQDGVAEGSVVDRSIVDRSIVDGPIVGGTVDDDSGHASRDQGGVASVDRVRVAVAMDDAFRFIYPSTRERLGQLAEVVSFAPAAGDDLPPCDAVYLPGGYPERHAPALESSPALDSIAERAGDGLPVFGECGGLMTLVESLTTVAGDRYEMAGILPGSVTMHERYQALDHVELRAVTDGVTAAEGDRHRGHEFHYSRLERGVDIDTATDARFAFVMERGDGIDGEHDGMCTHNTIGTYTHRHAASGAFDRLVESAREYART